MEETHCVSLLLVLALLEWEIFAFILGFLFGTFKILFLVIEGLFDFSICVYEYCIGIAIGQ